MNLFRCAFVAFGLATFILALAFSGFAPPTRLQALLAAAGIIAYLVASGALQVAHRKERRSAIELLAAAAYPAVVHGLMFLSLDLGARAFWVFYGSFQFLAVTGGFVLGIFLSPALALGGSLTRDQVAGVVRFGLRFVERLNRLVAFGLVLFAGVVGALAFFTARLFRALGDLSSLQKAVFYAGFAIAVLVVMRFAYRHTTFNLLVDNDLRRAYGPPPPRDGA